MRTQRKFLALLLAALLTLSIIPTTAMASGKLEGECGAEGSNATWKMEKNDEGEDSYTLTISGTGAMADYEGWNASPWAQVLTGQPADKNKITKLVIKSGITEIGAYAFTGHSGLKSILLPDTVVEVHRNAFDNCGNVTELSLPTSLKTIGEQAFQYLTSYTAPLALPDGLEEIEKDAFLSGGFTGSLKIPDTVTIIGRAAFVNDNKLDGSLTIGSSVKEIGASAFGGCKFKGDLVIPDSVETIGSGAFQNCSFETLTLGNSLKEIGDHAFYGNNQMKGILALPNSVETIGEEAFSALGYSSIQLGNMLESVGARAFMNCISVMTLDVSSIQGEVTYGEKAFYSMHNPGVVYVKDEAQKEGISSALYSNRAVFAVTNGGTLPFGTVFGDLKLEALVKDGFTFGGWYSQNGIETEEWGEAATASTELKAGDTWYAKWDTEEAPIHSFTSYASNNDATCTKNGTKTAICDDEDCDETVTQIDIGSAKGHQWDEEEVVLEAGCEICGIKKYTCSICQDTKVEVVPSNGHSWNDGAVTTPATSTTDGVKTYTCTVCGETRTETIPATGGSTSTGSHHSSSSSVTTYPVTVDSAKHGTVTASAKNASRGTTVTITVKADEGYELDSLTVTDKDGKTVKVTEGKNGKFTFTMPASKVTIEAGFAKSEETLDQRFTDVPEGYWAEDEINWAADNGYMNGNTATTFNPEGSVTRQQLWMILARLSGYQPADFAEARAWAVDNQISDGSNPANAVTRQQLVTILYRYAVRMGYKTTGTADLTAFPDHASVAAYAKDAMSWSVANGIVGGTSAGTLNPTGTATRAQFAVILYRFCEKIVG